MAQNINVDVTPNLFQPTLYYHQGDIGRAFTITISTKDGYTIPSGATVKIEATKPSGLGFSVSGTLSGNVVSFVSTEGMTDEYGRFPAQLKITSGNDILYTANFLMVGAINTHPDSTVDGSQETVIPQLTLLVERVENAAAAVLDTTTEVTTLPAGSQATYSFDEETNTATFGIPQGEAGAGSAGVVANAYSASSTYAVGDYVIHNSNLYRCTTTITTAESFTSAHWTQVVLADDVTDLKSELDDFEEQITTSETIHNEEYYTTPFTLGYVSYAGYIFSSETLAYTNKIEVNEGQILTTDRISNISGNRVSASFRFICAYNGDTVVQEKGINTETSIYTVPSGITHVIVTVQGMTTYHDHRVIIDTPYNKYHVKQNNIGGFRQKGNLSAGDEFVFPIQNIKNYKVFSFSGNITSFSSVVLGRNVDGTVKESVSVDASNIVITNTYGTATTVAHGLTITGNIQILIVSSERNRLSLIRVTSDGISFEYTALSNITWNGDKGYPFVKSVGSSLTGCSASWNCRHIDCPIWMFGDSYMSYDSARWAYYLIQDGFDKNCMINAYAGEDSQNALIAFNNLIAVARPKYIMWALGMNNSDTNSVPNADWLNAVNTVLDVCESKGIIPILCTIPTTPNVNNNYKNAWIKSSGYRYIDFAGGVNADSDGNWLAGMLSNDNVHPTEQGAKALYYKLLSEFPEVVAL